MSRMHYTESMIPKSMRVHVRYLTERRDPLCMHRWITIAKLLDNETDAVLAEGVSMCSQLDNPSRKIGRAIAVGRALKAYFASD